MSNLSIANDSKSGKYLTDQKDMNNDFQIHFIYLACKGKKDNEWDLNSEMEAEILKMNKKFYKMRGEKQKFKLDYRVDGKLDIPFARLDRKCRGGGWNNNYPDYYLQKMGFNNPKKLYYTYADYNNGGNSGMMGVHHGYTMLGGTSEKDRIDSPFMSFCTEMDSLGHAQRGISEVMSGVAVYFQIRIMIIINWEI